MTSPPVPDNKISLQDLGHHGKKFNTADDVAEIVKKIKETENLVEIQLSGNSFGIGACEAISAALKDHQTIEQFKSCLFGDIFTGRLRSEIPQCLTHFTDALLDKPRLKVLDLSDNAFGPDGLRPIIPLISACVTLEVLRLNNTGLGPQGGELLAQGLLECHSKCVSLGVESSLRVFVCGRSRLESGAMKSLARAFAAHAHLREIIMPQDGIRSEGIVQLIEEGLAKCGKLEILNLQDNTFTATGAKAFAKAFPKWPKLRELNLGDCLLTSKGARLIFKQISTMEKGLDNLESFNLQFNEIAEPEILLLATIIPKLRALKSLELNGNRFSEDGGAADAIRSALEEIGADGALGSLSDMEEDYSDEEEYESDEEREEDEEVADELAKELASTKLS